MICQAAICQLKHPNKHQFSKNPPLAARADCDSVFNPPAGFIEFWMSNRLPQRVQDPNPQIQAPNLLLKLNDQAEARCSILTRLSFKQSSILLKPSLCKINCCDAFRDMLTLAAPNDFVFHMLKDAIFELLFEMEHPRKRQFRTNLTVWRRL